MSSASADSDAVQPVRRTKPGVWLLVLLLLIAVAFLAYLALLSRSIVSGTVTLDGEPLTNGLVSFHPVGKGPISTSRLDASGTFSLHTGGSRGVTPGCYRVTIAANETGTTDKSVETDAAKTEGSSPIRPLITPARYADPDTSDLRAEVGWGINRFHFEINSDPPVADGGR
jgi:hypothetical protein